jgi:hypothetical protein
MAGGYIRKRKRKEGPVYEAVLYLGADPVTGKYRQQAKSFRTKREAQAALAKWQVEIDRGTFVEKSQKTVADLLRYWLESYALHNVRDTTFDQYSNTINVHIIPCLGHVQLQKRTPADLQQFYSLEWTWIRRASPSVER